MGFPKKAEERGGGLAGNYIYMCICYIYMCGDGGRVVICLHTNPENRGMGDTNSLHRTHMGCVTWTVRAQVL